MKVAADTGALVSLQLCGILEKSFEHFTYYIGKRIKEELEELSRYDDEIGIAAREVLSFIGKGIEVVETGEHEEGEYEALEILNKLNAQLLISDDIKFVKKLQDERVSFSTIILFILHKAGVITKEDALNALDLIFERRKWSENLIYITARAMLEKDE